MVTVAGVDSVEVTVADLTTGAGLTTEDFSATATFVSPTADSDVPWDFGFTFHRLSDQAQL